MKTGKRNNIYIWQHSEFPKLKWDSEVLLKPLSRLSHLHGQLLGRMSTLGFNDKNNSLLSVLTDELISSSEIEGVTLNLKSVRSSIARKLGIEDSGIIVEDHYIEGLVDVMLDAIRNCNTPITEERLFGWHAALFPMGRSGMYKITVADWRKGTDPMQVVSGVLGREKIHYEAPPSASVPAMMEQMMHWCNTSDHSPFLTAAIAHLWFVTIHPFDDGNGRISRTLADMFLARMDENSLRYYSMSAEINRNKKEYYDILERTQKGNLDITEWLLWFCQCLENAIARASSTVDQTLQKASFWDNVRDIDLNERQRKVINRLWDGFEGKLTSSKWAKICHCSQDTALRDINDLISKGILHDSGERGRSANYLLNH